MPKVNFFEEDIEFKLKGKRKYSSWLNSIAKAEGFELQELNYIFCSDTYLHSINQEYLEHDTFTDIITFDNSEEKGIIEGDIFVSIERIKENAITFKTPFDQELLRVLSHGLLHLCGYKDKEETDIALMRSKEVASIELFLESNSHILP